VAAGAVAVVDPFDADLEVAVALEGVAARPGATGPAGWELWVRGRAGFVEAVAGFPLRWSKPESLILPVVDVGILGQPWLTHFPIQQSLIP
jgi:hypothetical protein